MTICFLFFVFFLFFFAKVRVEYCGLCHSDLAQIDNEWNMVSFFRRLLLLFFRSLL